MPTVPDITGPYRFFLQFRLAYNSGFKAKELNRIRNIIVSNFERILEAWDEHCDEQ